jgi:hypothetical protein
MLALEKIAADRPDPQGAYFDNRDGLAGLPRKQHEGRATLGLSRTQLHLRFESTDSRKP